MKTRTSPVVRVLLCLLSLLLLLSILSLVACKNGKDPGNDPDKPAPGGDPSDPSGPSDPGDDEDDDMTADQILKTFPQKFFGDEQFRIAASSTYENVFTIEQFTNDDDYNGGTIHDALVDRDAMIEEYFGIELYYEDMLDSAMYSRLGNSVRAGDDDYQLLLGTLAGGALQFANANLLWDLHEIPNIDLTKPWWNKNSVNSFDVNGHIYMATGAITNRYVYAPNAMLFNKELLADASLTSPFELMERDEWTLETLALMIEGQARELGSDDTLGIDDFYGLAPANDSEGAFYVACGGTFTEKDGSGIPSLSHERSRNSDRLDAVIDLMRGDDVLHYKSLYDSLNTFRDGRAIFHSMALCDINMLADMEQEYGIAPMPKYDQLQEEYYSNANRYISTMAIVPSSVADTERTGLIIEAMAATSQYSSLQKQYETILLLRQAKDSQSKQSLITVVESTVYDWGYVFDFGSVSTTMRDIIRYGKSYASEFASLRGQAESALNEMLKNYGVD